MDSRAEQLSPMPAGLVCRHYLNGCCRYGSRCHYQHDWPAVPAARICRYYQKGTCWYGERCRYLHIRATDGDASLTSRRSSVPQLPVSSAGSGPPGRRGSEPALSQACGHIGGDLRGSNDALTARHTSTARRPLDQLIECGADSALEACRQLLQSSDASQARATNTTKQSTESSSGGDDSAAAATAAAAAEDREETDAYVQSKDVTCGICMDKVFEKTSADEQRFGILPSCNHAFCLRCIVTWRKTKDLQEDVIKGCPQCRVKSAFYVPHDYWVEGPAKESLIASFKEKCRKRRCSFFMRHGCCPFKSECIYWHDEEQRRRAEQLTEDLDNVESMVLLDFVMASLSVFGWQVDVDVDDDEDEDDEDAIAFHVTGGLGF